MRMEALKRIQDDLAECMPDMEFEIRVIDVATEKLNFYSIFFLNFRYILNIQKIFHVMKKFL